MNTAEDMLSLFTDRELGVGLRDEFPLLVDSDVVYFDSAASAQKPARVLDAVSDLYEKNYANVHRGVYDLGERATALFESSREVVKDFIGARYLDEVIFTRGTTESINLVAYSLGREILTPGTEVLVSLLEHHANFVPWQQIANQCGATVRYVGLTDEGELDLDDFRSKLSSKTKLVAVTSLANALGVVTPLPQIVELAHQQGALVVLDAAQSAPHGGIDVQKLDVDFLAFSGHKVYGPTGIGVLYGKRELLANMSPFLYGGEMIRKVSVDGTTFREAPHKFEAGTPNIAGAVGLAEALRFLNELGFSDIQKHESFLVRELENSLSAVPGISVLGPKGKHQALLTFTHETIHPHDISQFLNTKNICVRAGHHCAQPLLAHFGAIATTRVSVGVYNSLADVEAFSSALGEAVKFFS